MGSIPDNNILEKAIVNAITKKDINKVDNSGLSIEKQAKQIYDTSDDAGPNTKGTHLENWYKQRPYAFKFREQTFYLPISPSNLTISTHFATNIITTMYGTVEEHSEQRYFDIVINGTTGMSPRYYKTIGSEKVEAKTIGRAGSEVKSMFGGVLGGFFKRTQAMIENTINQASDLLGEDEPTTGIDLSRTGYAAFHNFYKFLLLHKKHIMGQDGAREIGSGDSFLRFINYKDNNQYDVVIQGFQLSRDSSNPMLYNYNITMRAYNLRTAGTISAGSDISSRADELGLSGIETSLFSKMSNKARKAKNTAYSTIAGFKGFGA